MLKEWKPFKSRWLWTFYSMFSLCHMDTSCIVLVKHKSMNIFESMPICIKSFITTCIYLANEERHVRIGYSP